MKTIFSILILAGLLSLNISARNKADKCFSPKEIKKAMNKAAEWQLAHPKHELYDWTNGAFYAGLSMAYKTTGNQNLLDGMMKMGSANKWRTGPRLHHADDY